MKTIFQTKLIVIVIIILIFMFVKCNVKARAICEIENQKNQTEKNINPMEKTPSDVFPFRDLIIKI